MRLKLINKLLFSLITVSVVSIFLFSNEANAQFVNKWMSAGSLHNWYSAIGCEIEHGWVARQQYGMQWPAIYRYQDMQAARGFWLGAKNFTDENGNNFPYKVVTIGPRAPSFWAAYPIKMELISKVNPTEVTVDGVVTEDKSIVIDRIDPDLIADRMIHNIVNTQLGVTMDRKIFQFSQPQNDNYIVYEYTFTNTGNTNADDAIELPNNTVEDLYLFWTFRNAVNQSTRYQMGNETGWGKNTMNDARGDGPINSAGDPPDEQFRAMFSWHGYFPQKAVSYDNIGGPLWALNPSALLYNSPEDTIGRLGASQFLGTVTLYADKSPTEKVNDPAQPSNTFWCDSDFDNMASNANAFDITRMTDDYLFMSTQGHMSPRHANSVEPSGDFAAQRSAPHIYAPGSGGASYNVSYGPYTLAPGESIRIVVAEAAASMSREEQIRVGRLYKRGQITDLQKNTEVITQGRDSLFKTFRNAINAFENNWNIPATPRAPANFNVNSGGDRISLSWVLDPEDPNPPSGFRIYRALGDFDQDYEMIVELPAGSNSYDDLTLVRGFNYYYYMTCVGPNGLESSRYATQTFDPANLKRPAGKSLSDIRIVPNPYIINPIGELGFPGTSDYDKIAFYNIPGNCTINIYTELGELIKTIEHTDGSGDEFWYSVTSSNQIVVSGIYIAVITDNNTGEKHIAKFAVIR
jgi:hypothetical protein